MRYDLYAIHMRRARNRSRMLMPTIRILASCNTVISRQHTPSQSCLFKPRCNSISRRRSRAGRKPIAAGLSCAARWLHCAGADDEAFASSMSVAAPANCSSMRRGEPERSVSWRSSVSASIAIPAPLLRHAQRPARAEIRESASRSRSPTLRPHWALRPSFRPISYCMKAQTISIFSRWPTPPA